MELWVYRDSMLEGIVEVGNPSIATFLDALDIFSFYNDMPVHWHIRPLGYGLVNRLIGWMSR